MTRREIEAQFYADCDEALRKRDVLLDKAEAARAQAERDIDAAIRGFDDACRDAARRRNVAIAALNKATP